MQLARDGLAGGGGLLPDPKAWALSDQDVDARAKRWCDELGLADGGAVLFPGGRSYCLMRGDGQRLFGREGWGPHLAAQLQLPVEQPATSEAEELVAIRCSRRRWCLT